MEEIGLMLPMSGHAAMRILYITEIYPDIKHGIGVWGGGEKQFYDISRIMAKRGHNVTVLTCRFPGQSPYVFKDGIRIFRQGLARDSKTGGARRVILPIITYILKTSKRAVRSRPDIIHSNTYFPVFAGEIAALLQSVPLVTTFHDLYGLRGWIEAQRSVVWGLLGHFATVTSAKLPNDRIIAVSPQVKRKLLRLGVRSEKITVVPNGVDLALFKSANRKREASQILYVGRLVHFKHVDNLIRAFPTILKEVPEAALRIVGGGPEEKTLRDMTHQLGLEDRIVFTGITPSYEAAARFFKESAIFALPSTVEGESIAAKEAMASGLPVVAMNVKGSGVLSLIEDGVNGFLIDPNDQDALASKLIELLKDPKKTIAMGEAARKSVEKYSWNVIADRVLDVYNNVLA